MRDGSYRTVLDRFRDMQIVCVYPNQFTLSTILKCCSSLGELQLGKGVHGWILRNETEPDAIVENSVLDMYVKCGKFSSAERFFEVMKEKDTTAWNIMIRGYLKSGDIEKSLKLFRSCSSKDAASWNTIISGLMHKDMQNHALEVLYDKDLLPLFNEVTFSTALVLATSLNLLNLGRQIHSRVMRLEVDNNCFVRSSLIDMYCKCGHMEKASAIVGKMQRQTPKMFGAGWGSEIVSYSALVSGYVHKGDLENAFRIFITMIREKYQVDKFTITSIIYACTNARMLQLGVQIHAFVQKIGHKIDFHLCSALVDMYAKSGSVEGAYTMFKEVKDANVVLWTSMICGFAINSKGEEAVLLFENMLREGISPNPITFIGVLTACLHAGLVIEGSKYFRVMKEVYGIQPEIEHFICMVDLYGRSGFFDEAKEFINENGISNLPAVWKSFLSSCQLHKNAEGANWVFQKLKELVPDNPELHLLISNMYAIDDRWEEVANIRTQMHLRGLQKLPGQSWIQR